MRARVLRNSALMQRRLPLTGSPWTTCRWLWCRSAVKSEHTTARATQSVHPGARYAKRAAVRAAAVFSPPSLGFPNPLLWFCPPLIFPPGPPSSLQEEEYYGDGRIKEREKALRKHRFDFMLAHKGNDNIKGLRLLSRAKSLRRSVPCLPPCFCPCPWSLPLRLEVDKDEWQGQKRERRSGPSSSPSRTRGT